MESHEKLLGACGRSWFEPEQISGRGAQCRLANSAGSRYPDMLPGWRLPMSIRSLIEMRLNAALHPDRLVVLDESAAHAGHAGHRPGGESHFRVRVVSPAFAGRSRVD